MKKYVLKRILMMIPTLLAVVFIIFVLINITPGDPGRIMLPPKKMWMPSMQRCIWISR